MKEIIQLVRSVKSKTGRVGIFLLKNVGSQGMKVAGKPVLYTYVDFLGGTPPNFYIRVMYQEL